MKKKFLTSAILTSSLLLLVACSDESKEDKEELKRIQTEKEPILSYYEDDLMEKYIYEDKSDKELRLEMVEEMLGIQHQDTPLAKTGIMNNQGLVVEAGILNGGYIPPFSALPVITETSQDKKLARINEKSLKQFTDILLVQKKANEDERFVSDTDLLIKNIEKRKNLIGKEKPIQDLDLWSFNDKIEQRYQEDLKSLRKSIQEKREIEQAREKVRILQEQVETIAEEEQLKEQMERLDKEHNDKINKLIEKEQKFKEKLDKDKDLTEDEKKGIKEEELNMKEEVEKEDGE